MNIYRLWWFISYDDDYHHNIYNLDHLDGKIYEWMYLCVQTFLDLITRP